MYNEQILDRETNEEYWNELVPLFEPQEAEQDDVLPF